MKLQVCLLCLVLVSGTYLEGASAPRRSSPSLTRQIDAILSDPAISRSHWGISVITVSGEKVFALNDGQLFAPASNAKLFTTAAAFALLPVDERFHTRLEARGNIDPNGVLHGDLVIVGSGDFSLSGRAWPYSEKTERPDPPLHALSEMADQLVREGRIKRIEGRIVGDDTWLPYEPYGAGWSWDDLQWDYGAPISALTINDNVVYLNILPGANASDPVAIAWDPAVPYYSLENTATTAPAGSKPQLGIDRQPGSRTIRLFGSLPIGNSGAHLALAIEDPAEFAAIALRQMLIDRGIPVTGAAADSHQLPVATSQFLAEVRTPLKLEPSAALPTPASEGQVLATHDSPPLSEDLTVINKVSQNLHAELILHDLGRAVLNDGSTTAGARVVRQFLAGAGVISDDVFLFDGSGLSSADLVTPRAITTLLSYAAKQPWGNAYEATLPIAGIDGTLDNRFTASQVKGKLSAKTGTLSEVNALSGYLTTRRHSTLVLSILCNGHDPSSNAERKAMDRIVEAIYATE